MQCRGGRSFEVRVAKWDFMPNKQVAGGDTRKGLEGKLFLRVCLQKATAEKNSKKTGKRNLRGCGNLSMDKSKIHIAAGETQLFFD